MGCVVDIAVVDAVVVVVVVANVVMSAGATCFFLLQYRLANSVGPYSDNRDKMLQSHHMLLSATVCFQPLEAGPNYFLSTELLRSHPFCIRHSLVEKKIICHLPG